MALYHLFGLDTGICLDIIDVLGVVGQQLALILEEFNESMSWREFLLGRQDILRNRKENVGIFPEDMDIENLLWVAQTKMFQLRVKTSIL